MMKCPNCMGTGDVIVLDSGVSGTEEYAICGRCKGSGEIPEATAPETLIRRIDELESRLSKVEYEYKKPVWAVGQVVRETGLVEDTCEHGVGHPNIAWMSMHGKPGQSVHGCDGCCCKS